MTSSVFQSQAAAKADDLHQNGIGLELMHINPPGHKFDVNIFYKVKITRDNMYNCDWTVTMCSSKQEMYDKFMVMSLVRRIFYTTTMMRRSLWPILLINLRNC
jgi:hypothetical protein